MDKHDDEQVDMSPKAPKKKRNQKKERKDASDGRVWGHRLRKASEARKAALKRGEALRMMVSGEETHALQEKMQDGGDDWIFADWNKINALVRVMIPALLHSEPDVTVAPWDELDETSVRKADLYTYLCRRFIRTNHRMEHSKAALFEAMIYGKGCIFTDWNKEEKQPRSRFQTIKEIYIDPAYDGTPNTMQWVGRDLVLPVELAKRRWPDKAKLIKADTMDVSEGESESISKDEEIPKDRLKNHVTFTEVWVSGRSTEFPEMKLEDGETEDKNDATGFHGKNEVITLLSDPTGKMPSKVIDRKPWPCTMDENEFPFSFLELTNDPNKVYGCSILQPAQRLQELINVMLTSLVTRQVQSAKDIISIDSKAFEDPEAVEEALQEGKQLTVVRMKEGRSVEKAIQQTSLGVPNQAQSEIMSAVSHAFEDVTGYSELSTGDVRKAENATAAQYSEERRQSSIANAVSAVERWQGNISRKELMVAQTLMTAMMVSEVAPPRLLGEPETSKDNDGEVVTIYPYWQDSQMTPRTIRNESQCFVRAGSMRFLSVQERRDSLAELKRLHGESLALAGSAGYQLPPEAVAADLKMTEMLANLSGISEFKDLQIDVEDIEPLEDEAEKQQEVQQAAAQQQQQLAQAIPQMMQQVLAETLPPMIQQIVAPMFADFGQALLQKQMEAGAMQQQAAQAQNPFQGLIA